MGQHTSGPAEGHQETQPSGFFGLFFTSTSALVPVIGLVENMAGYACPHCGKISDPFGQGGAEATAQRLGLPFLGRVPLAIDIRTASDAGKPPAADPNDTIFAPIAARVADWLATH